MFQLTGASGSVTSAAVHEFGKEGGQSLGAPSRVGALTDRSSCDYRHIVQNGRLVESTGARRTLHPPRPCVAGVACEARELSRHRPQHSSVCPRVEPSQIEGATWPSQGAAGSGARSSRGEGKVMAEFHRYPLRVQQSKLDGWWFIFIDEVPGLGVVGPNYEDLLDRLKVVAGNLFRARGETVTDIKIIPSEKPALQVFH